jgi:hypothetical protein
LVTLPSDPLARARALLSEARSAEGVHGVAPRLLLLEILRGLAVDLLGYFDALPGHRFTGIVRRRPGALGLVLPPRLIPHRVVLGRYLHYTPPVATTPKYAQSVARIAVVALGADGVLRRGVFAGTVVFPSDEEPPDTPLAHDDLFLSRVPPWPLLLRDWSGGVDPAEVAGPVRMVEALTGLVERVMEGTAEEQALVNALLQRSAG